jgi:hypothetical protein
VYCLSVHKEIQQVSAFTIPAAVALGLRLTECHHVGKDWAQLVKSFMLRMADLTLPPSAPCLRRPAITIIWYLRSSVCRPLSETNR